MENKGRLLSPDQAMENKGRLSPDQAMENKGRLLSPDQAMENDILIDLISYTFFMLSLYFMFSLCFMLSLCFPYAFLCFPLISFNFLINFTLKIA